MVSKKPSLGVSLRKEPVNILDLCCGSGLVRLAALRRFKRRIHYVGVDAITAPAENSLLPIEEYGQKIARDAKTRLVEAHFPTFLSFSDPVFFRRQLSIISQGRLFDEIHLHMPNYLRAKKRTALAKVIASFLKPGGRFFHSFDNLSNNLFFNDVKKGAEKIGLVVEEEGKREYHSNPWVTEPKRADSFANQIGLYTKYKDSQIGFFVLRRPFSSRP